VNLEPHKSGEVDEKIPEQKVSVYFLIKRIILSRIFPTVGVVPALPETIITPPISCGYSHQ
jgi:hypothetical protein